MRIRESAIDLVMVAHPDPDGALLLVSRLVDEHWVACGHVLPPGTSIFFWQNELRIEREVMILLKSVPENRKALEREIRRDHPYAVPEILFLSTDHGSSDYLSWVRESCRIASMEP
jgi:periplasmic divalent cation tolerance protein